MKCPKCKVKMIEYTCGNMLVQNEGYFRCDNKNCWFYGIERYIEIPSKPKVRK